MHVRKRIVYDLRAALVKLVYHPCNALLVAGYRRRRYYDRIPEPHVEPVRRVRHPEKAAHRFSLAARSYYANPVFGIIFQLVYVDDALFRYVEVTHFPCHLRYRNHASALEAYHSVALYRYVGYLLYPIYVGSKRCNYHSPGRAVKIMLERVPDIFFGLRIAASLYIRAVRHKRQNALGAVPRKTLEIYRFTVYRREVELKIAGVYKRTHGRAHGYRHCAGYRMADLYELYVEAAERYPVARRYAVEIGVRNVVLVELMFY